MIISDARSAVHHEGGYLPSATAAGRRTGRLLQPVLIRFFCGLLLLSGSAYSFKLPFFQKQAGAGEQNTEVFDWFFSEAYAHNGFHYTYPPSSSVSIIRGNAHSGKYALQFDLDPNDYSGGSI